MRDIPDDPIVASMLRTGYPPWMQGWEDDEDDDDGLYFEAENDEEQEE